MASEGVCPLLMYPNAFQHSPLLMQGYGVYRFADKYGANVDGYSPIYTPDSWAESGGTYKLGTKGLIAWCVPLATNVAATGVWLMPMCPSQAMLVHSTWS